MFVRIEKMHRGGFFFHVSCVYYILATQVHRKFECCFLYQTPGFTEGKGLFETSFPITKPGFLYKRKGPGVQCMYTVFGVRVQVRGRERNGDAT